MAPDRFSLPIDFEDWTAEKQVAFFEEERSLNQFKRQERVSVKDRAEMQTEMIHCTRCGEGHEGLKRNLNFCRDCGIEL